MTAKTCVNCPGATDHDTAHCPMLRAEGAHVRAPLRREHFAPGQEGDRHYAQCLEADGAQGEREAFEAAMRTAWNQAPVNHLKHDGSYWNHRVRYCYEGWEMARAALAQPSPAPELERPEVVAWQYRVTAGPQTGWSLWHPGKGEEFERSYTVERRSLMTVAQHDRIVGALRAVQIETINSRNAYQWEYERAIQERDAAQARVAELEKQEPMLHINPLVVDELLGRAKRTPGGLTWSKERCGSWTFPLYAAPVAQAGLAPEECPHLILFDDADVKPIMFAGSGARRAALAKWEQVSINCNAHLFVRIEKNCRDDRYPCAMLAAAPAQGSDDLDDAQIRTAQITTTAWRVPTMSDVKRYAFQIHRRPYGLEEVGSGNLVMHSDYAKLEAEAQALREEVAALRARVVVPDASSQRLLVSELVSLAAGLACRNPLRRITELCDEQSRVTSARLRGYIDEAGDSLTDYAVDLRRIADELARLNSEAVSEGLLRRVVNVESDDFMLAMNELLDGTPT